MPTMRPITSLLMLAMVMLGAAGFPSPAAPGITLSADLEAPNPLLIPIKKSKKCVLLVRQSGRDVLVNACNTCRVVHVQRKRPGEGFPVTRTFTLAKRTQTPLSFRGRGQSRIISDGACGDSAPEQLEGEKCVKFHRFPNGSPGLFNQCPACRVAIIEFEMQDGRRTRQSYRVNNRAYVALFNRTAKTARIAADRACQ